MSSFNRRGFFTFIGSLASAIACKTVGNSAKESSDGLSSIYDYIVVGSGAGGGPLAVNLSRAGFKVLLLEAGTDSGDEGVYKVPALHTQSTEEPSMAWDFYVNHFKNVDDDRADGKFVNAKNGILYPRAGTLGGCTAHNAMITVFPLQKDWDQMAKDVGDATYNAKNMTKYYALWEDAEYLNDTNRQKGWLPIHLANPFIVAPDRAIKSMLIGALRSLDRGINRHVTRILAAFDLVTNLDSNALTSERDTTEKLIMIPMAITGDSVRFSTRDLIHSNVGGNLTTFTGALVTRVLFDEESVANGQPEAVGVEYMIGERIYKASKEANPSSARRYQAHARREVILAGGTFNTPQMLMASGIGPKQDLEKFERSNPGYRVILDRPGVGSNLQDRYEISVVSETRYPVDLVKDCKFEISMDDLCFDQWQGGRGPYTSNGGIVGIMKKSNPTLTNPDLFIFMLPVDFHGYYPGYSQNLANQKSRVTWCILKSHTSNRAGKVQLKDLDPTNTPSINFNYFQDGQGSDGRALNGDKTAQIDDLDAVVTAIEYVRSIMEDSNKIVEIVDTLPFIEGLLNDTSNPYFEEIIPGPAVQSEEEIREWARTNSWGHHACGTCMMGPKSDPMAVVDSKFNVIGTKRLRIVDASIFPRIPGYFIVSSIYTMSERATDEILESAGRPRRIRVS